MKQFPSFVYSVSGPASVPGGGPRLPPIAMKTYYTFWTKLLALLALLLLARLVSHAQPLVAGAPLLTARSRG